MLASGSSGVVQHPENTLGHAPTHSSVPDTASSNLHPQLLLFYLAATCVCLIMAYFMDSRRRASKRGRDKAKPETPLPYYAGGKSPILVAPGEYIRPLGNLETFMEVGGEYGCLNTVQTIWLGSKDPISPSDVRKALHHVVQKNHMLQVCVEWRGMRPWFKRMKEFVFDFAVEDDEVMAVFYTQLQKPYDMKNGPLWRSRLVPIRNKLSDSHKAALVISAHHCITDGHTNMQLCRDFLEVLNANLSGRIHEIPLRPVIPAASDSLITKRDWYYVFTYFWTKLYATILTDYSNKLYFKGALKQPQTKIALTKIIRENFTVDETKELIRHCRENGVAMHSLIMATANLALLYTVQQRAKYRVDMATVNTVNCINMRRYFPDNFKQASGCHISLEEKEVLIPGSAVNSKGHFWSLVKTFQQNLNDSLNVKQIPVKNSPLFRPSTILLHVNYELTKRGLKNRTDNHMISTNMGNLRTLLPAKYEGPVEITDILRSVSSELTGNPFTLVFHTFDDRFMISVDYYTNKMTDDAAAQFFSNLTHFLGNIARHGSVREPVPSLEGFIAHVNGTIIPDNGEAPQVPKMNGVKPTSEVNVHAYNNGTSSALKASALNGPLSVANGIKNCNGHLGINTVIET